MHRPHRLARPSVASFRLTSGAVDRWLSAADSVLRTLSGVVRAARPYPAEGIAPCTLTPAEQRLSGALMRIDHVGEVCAQALYVAQSLTARTPELRRHFDASAREEADHLSWTRQRLRDLHARPSVLNPVWFGGAFGIGLLAGLASDATSLGFVVETERQVEQHLAGHLARLPAADAASRAIVAQMKTDEARHAHTAASAGATALPAPARWAMRAAARVMTTVAHRV